MSDHAGSAAPPNCLKVWSDGKSIFVEIPGIAGRPPYITSYSYDYRGVDLTLSLLGQHRIDYDYQGTYSKDYLKPSKEPGTHNQRAAAEAWLRQRGVIK